MSKLGIPFIHKTHARARSVKISLLSDGTVVVTTPPRFSKMVIPGLVERARPWIEKQRFRIESKPALFSSDFVYIFGKKYQIEIDSKMDGSIRLGVEKLHVSPFTLSESKTKLTLTAWLKNRAIDYCLPRLSILAKHMHTTYSGVRFKQQKTCWGSCSSQKNINLNWRLVHAPKAVIDYVIIHELAHTVHLNHGHQFWDLVAKFDPDYPLHRGWLKRHGNTED